MAKEEEKENKSQEVKIQLARDGNKVVLTFLDCKEEKEFSTEEDAEKAEELAALVINLVQWLVGNGAVFIAKEENQVSK